MTSALPKLRRVAPADTQAPEIRRLSSLLEVSQALSGTLNLKSALHHSLEILARHHGAVGSMVGLRGGARLRVEASDGAARSAARSRSKPGSACLPGMRRTPSSCGAPSASTEPML